MSRMFHLHLSVRGAVQWNAAEVRHILRSVKKRDGTAFRDAREFRAFMLNTLARGVEALDISNGGCDNFDPKTGCRGHQVIKPEAA